MLKTRWSKESAKLEYMSRMLEEKVMKDMKLSTVSWSYLGVGAPTCTSVCWVLWHFYQDTSSIWEVSFQHLFERSQCSRVWFHTIHCQQVLLSFDIYFFKCHQVCITHVKESHKSFICWAVLYFLFPETFETNILRPYAASYLYLNLILSEN